MNKKTIRKRKLRKECFNLDQAFLKWLKEHLEVYLHDASKIVDFSFRDFEHRGKMYKQDELIKRMLRLIDTAYTLYDYDEKYAEAIDELLDIWKLVFHSMWW